MRRPAKLMERIQHIIDKALGRGATKWHLAEAKWRLWKRIEKGLLVSGLSLLGLYGAVRLDSYLNSRAAIESFESVDPSAIGALPPVEDHATEKAAGHDGEARKKPSPGRRAPLGVLEIASIDLKVPVFDGTDRVTLNRGAGRIAGTALPGQEGNIGIAGHRDSFFRPLKDIKAGDSVVLRTESGIYTYVVDRFQIVSPRDVSVLRAEATSSLTLVTCYPFYFVGNAPQRFVVTAYLTHHTAAGPTTESPGY